MKLRRIALGLVVLLLNFGYALAEEGTEIKSSEPIVTEEASGDKTAHKYCLVCGPEEETENLGVSYKYKGKKYSFCSMDCLKAFKENPGKFFKIADNEGTDHVDDKHDVPK